MDLNAIPVLPDFGDTEMANTVRAIFTNGQAMGRNSGIFALAGDVLAVDPAFLNDLGASDAIQWGDYAAELEPLWQVFQTPVEGQTSFTRSSAAAGVNWTAAMLLDPAQADASRCQPGETPLLCEIRLAQPAYMLIALGRNETDPAFFQQNLDAVVQTVANAGVVPVVVTLPGDIQQVGPADSILVTVAQTRHIPVWNLWRALQGLPGGGVNPDGSLSSSGPGQNAIFTPEGLQFGANRANLSALQLLKALRSFLMPGT